MPTHLTITNGAMVAFGLCFVLIFAAVAFLIYTDRQIERERDLRSRQVNAALLINCRKREQEIADLHRELGLPHKPFDCSSLILFPK